MAAAYFAVGRLSLLLAIPPGYATAVWPAAGIALAGTLLLGNRVWPGIVLGSFAVNVWTSLDATSLRTLATSGTLAATIGLGAALQAVLGALLVRRLVGHPTLFLRDREVLRFLLLGGPVACLASAVWGVTTLLLAGVIGPSEYVFHWWTWWVGDTIGVITVAPLVLIWLTEAGRVTPRRRAAITVPTAVAFALVVAFFALSAAWERDRVRLEFGRQTDTLAQTLERSVEGDIEVLYSIQSFFASSAEVDRAEFRTFVTRLLARHPSLQALSWNPRIRGPEREAYEQRARRDGPADFRITEPDAQGDLVAASPRPEYVAVYYIEPLAGNERALGFDVASDPVRRAALDRARATGQASATEPIILVQDAGRRVGFLAFLPIRGSRRTSAEGDGDVLGYATGVFRVADIVAAALTGADTAGVRMQVYDATAGGRRPLLDDGAPETAESAQVPARVIFLDLAGRRWELRFIPTREYLVLHRSWESWGVLVLGMLFTGLLGAFLLIVTGRAGQLQTVNAELRSQIAERVRAERALHEAEERAALIVSEALDAVITIDLEGLVTSWNPQAERLFGWTEREILGRRLAESIIPPEHRAAHERGLARFQETGEGAILGRRLELTAQHRDGTAFPVELAVTRVMIRGRVAFSAFVRDISERKRAEVALEKYAQRVSLLHEIDRAILAVHSPTLIAETTLRHLRRLVRAPRAVLALFDLAAGSATSLAVDVEGETELQPGVRFPLEMVGDLTALRRGVVQILEVPSLSHLALGRTLAAEGIRSYAVVPLIARGELIGSLNVGATEPGGPSAGDLLVAREIADQLAIALQQGRLHEDLKHSRDALKAVVDGAPVAIYAVDNSGAVTMWNPAAERLFGWTEAQVIGRPLPTVPPDKAAEFLALSERTRQGEALTGVEARRQRKDGSAVELLVSTAPLRSADGTVQGFVNLSLDVTERKRAAARSEALARVGQELSRTLDTARVADLIVSSALNLLQVRSAALFTRDGSAGPLVCLTSAGATDRDRWRGRTLLPGQGAAGQAVAEERPVWSPDFLADPRFQVPDWLVDRAAAEDYRAVLAVPLKTKDEVTGVLGVGDIAGRAFTEDDVQLLSAFADQAAIAFQNARVYAQTERARREATDLADVARELTETLDVPSVGERIVDRVLPLFKARLAIVRVLEPDGSLRAIAASGTARIPFGSGHVLPPGIGLMSSVVTEGRSLWTTDARTDPKIARSADYTERLEESGTEAAVAVPLRVQGRTIGVLGISDAAGRAFSPGEISLLQAFADQAAVALENARLFAEQRRAEEAVRDARDRLHGIIEASPLAIIALDERGLIRTWNRAATNLFGWTQEEVLDRPLPTIPEDRQEEYEALKAGYRVGTAVTDLETKRRRKDGSIVEVVLSVAPITDAEGRSVGSIGVMADITQRKQLQAQLVQAQKMEAVGLLAGGIAHDFNNLLTVIGGRSTLLVQRGGLSEAMRRDAELISKTAERAAALTRQLLAFSRKQVFEPKPVELNALVGGVAPMLRRLIGEHIELVIIPGGNLGHVMADPGHVEQVIMNLIVNARDAMPDGGMVKIETASRALQDMAHHAQGEVPPGRYVTLSVQDTGCGMDPVTLARIFEPFFTTKEPGKGTGLGLSTVHGIVHQSGGHIGVDSTVGRGTTFTIYLPQITGAVAVSEARPGEPREMARGTETVLLVEDDEEVRRLASEILKACGYNVLEAGDPLEALTIAERRAGAIDLLLTDMVMPAMRGSELAQRLGALCPTLRVLYMSGYTDEMITAASANGPARAFLHKPFTPDDLARKIREVLAPR